MNTIWLNTRNTCSISLCFLITKINLSLLTQILLSWASMMKGLPFSCPFGNFSYFPFQISLYLTSLHIWIPQASIDGSFLYWFYCCFEILFYTVMAAKITYRFLITRSTFWIMTTLLSSTFTPKSLLVISSWIFHGDL